jgi:hypothetical protein
MRCLPETRVWKKTVRQGERAFVTSSLAAESHRENAFVYDGCASGRSVYAYVQNNPLSFVDPSGLALLDGRQVGKSILGLAPKINSPLEHNLIRHYFYGDGKPYYMTPGETSRYQQNPNSTEFDFAIGSANPDVTTDRIDTYDFNPGNRDWYPELATRGAGIVGKLFGGEEFDIYPSGAICK